YLVFLYGAVLAGGNHTPEKLHEVKRHKAGLFLGNTLVRGTRNSFNGKEQYVLAPTFGIDYEHRLSPKWAIGSYNELALLNIEVEQDHESFIKRENVFLFSAVVLYEFFPDISIYAGTGFETDPHHTFWIRYFGAEYTFLKSMDWRIAFSAGYINKDSYDAFSFGLVLGRSFGKPVKGRK
ncbi:MAG: hypothetical protein MI975_10240, partial [Cytophagales bacterium]|nr:hypothetical protein [Cytophagales bacterium]